MQHLPNSNAPSRRKSDQSTKLQNGSRMSEMPPIPHQSTAPLQRGEVQGYDFNRMTVEFTMLDQDKTIMCAISTTAMDDLERRSSLKAEQRVEQFMRLREAIEERASRKFFEEQTQAGRPIVLRSNDFFK